MNPASLDRPLLATSQEMWEREYADHRVIPTSTRTSPSRALLLFQEFFNVDRPLRILDVGSGTGRNAVHLARKGHTVYALEFAAPAISQLQQAIEKEGLMESVFVVRSSLTENLPFRDASFDLVIDSYVSCHFLDPTLQTHFSSEVSRVLRQDGLLFSSQFSTEDEYYRELIADASIANPVVIDPRNGITKQLYSRESAHTIFAQLGPLRCFAQFEFKDVVIDRLYQRSVFVLLVERSK